MENGKNGSAIIVVVSSRVLINVIQLGPRWKSLDVAKAVMLELQWTNPAQL